ncbi:MAG: RluA family pseudouridine synthase [Planctomycetes bacterium]|nr:RluA family pseudouridine synthase [Planctomycetota bacterium]
MNSALEVLFADNHVLAVAKPAGMPVAPDASGDASLLELARAWVRAEYHKPGEVFLGLVHRLDRPVSGVVVFGRTSKGASRLAAAFRARTAEKRYLGVTASRPRADQGVVDQWLVKDAARNVVRVAAAGEPGARRAVTRWRVVEERGGRVLLAFEPATGRPHQLRVAAATLGSALLGDLKYGAREALPDASVALHAFELVLAHPTRSEPLRLAAPVPFLAIWRFSALDGGAAPPFSGRPAGP